MSIQDPNMFTKNCISCKPVDQVEAQNTLFTTEHCRVVLRADDQAWLGRCIIVPRKHTPSFEQMSPEARKDVYECRAKINTIYRKLFNMNFDNWAQLGNLTRDHEGKLTTNMRYFHMHYHVIPRYEEEVKYLNRTFTDLQFGKPLNIDPACGHKKVVLSAEELLHFRDEVQWTMLKDGLISEGNLKDTMPSENILSLAAQIKKTQNANTYRKIALGVPAILSIAGIALAFLKNR